MTVPKVDVKDQVSYCGVACGTCGQGSGRAEKSAKQLLKLIDEIEVKDWAPHVRGGAELNWDATEKTLEWMTKYTGCRGCLSGGGSPGCAIRVCAREKGYSICNECNDLEECSKFDFLGGDKPSILKRRLVENKGKSREQIIAEARARDITIF